MKRQSSTEVYLLFSAISVIWGLAFVAIRRADFELSPVNLTLFRWLVASLGYVPLLLFAGRPKTKFERGDALRLLVVALFQVVVYHLALNYAEKTVSSSLAGLLISTGPVFAVLLSVVSLKERVGARLVFALVLAIGGAAVLAVPDLDLGFVSALGPLAVIFAAFSYSVYAVASKPLVAKYGALPVSTWIALVGTGMLLPLISPSFISEASRLSSVGWGSVLFLSLLSTVLSYYIFFTLVSTRAVSTLSVQLYLIPLVSVVGGVLLLRETLTLYTIVGGGLLLAAVTLATRTQH